MLAVWLRLGLDISVSSVVKVRVRFKMTLCQLMTTLPSFLEGKILDNKCQFANLCYPMVTETFYSLFYTEETWLFLRSGELE